MPASAVQVSFDEYLLDRARVFRAMFPDESRSQRLSDVSKPNHFAGDDLAGGDDDEAKLILCACVRAGGVESPAAAAAVPPPHRAPGRRHAAAPPRRRARPPNRAYAWTSKIHPQFTHLCFVQQPVNRVRAMCLFVCLFGPEGAAQTEWELRGLERDYAPASFDLGVRGSLYADRSRGRRACRLRGHLEISIGCVLPPPMRLVPDAVMRGVAESVSVGSNHKN